LSILQNIGNLLYQYSPVLYKKSYTIFKNNQDKKEIEFLKQNIKLGDHVLDIGANIGFYSKIISNCVGDTGKVYSFEPDKKNFYYLQKNTSDLKNIQLNNKAVSSKSDKLKIYTSKELNVDHRTYPVDNYDTVYDIDSIAIDDYWPHGIEASGASVEDYFKIILDLGYTIQLLENGKTQSISLENISRFKGQAKEIYYNLFLN
jgi:FkbM family methyltransferase